MRLRRSLVILAGAALLVGLFGPATASAADPRFKAEAPPKQVLTGTLPSLEQFKGSLKTAAVVLEIAGEPVGVVAAKAAALGRPMIEAQKDALRGQYKTTQRGLYPAIAAAGGTVTAQLTDAINGIKVSTRGTDVAKLAKIAGVTAVRPVRTYTVDHTNSVPYVGAPAAWGLNGVNGATGAGVKIGIIDTGIDYTHANFGGPGTAQAYAIAASLPAVVVNKWFPSAKVAGGWDFAGDYYNADDRSPIPAGQLGAYDPVPRPDGNPLDCLAPTVNGYPSSEGHGSHVSGSAAGYGVTSTGGTFMGPYNSNTFTTNTFRIGPGVAPQATLYGLRVFGCYGSTNLAIDAIDWAVAHNLNVINMSLGSPYGQSTDADAVAVDNASLAGVMVVMSAGNENNVLGITGSPGIATRGLSVAANDPLAVIGQAVLTFAQTAPIVAPAASPSPTSPVVPGPGKSIPPGMAPAAVGITLQLNNNIPVPPAGITAPIFIAGSSTGFQGCVLADFAGAAGTIAVAQRGSCPRVDRAILGQQAGAVAVILVNNASGFPPFEGPIGGVTIPFLGADQSTMGTFNSHAGQTATIEFSGYVPNPGFSNFASFTSSGPRDNDSWLKPDVTAPGVGILSTAVGTGNEGLTFSGTSMASPHVAGLAALVRQKHPAWTPEQVKAAITGTACPVVNGLPATDPLACATGVGDYTLLRGGAGFVRADAATRTNTVLIGDPGTGSVSFGYNEFKAGGGSSVTKTLTLVTSNTKAVYNLSAAIKSSPGVSSSVSISPSQVLVGPNTPATIQLTLTLNPGTMPSYSLWGGLFVSGEVVAVPVTTAPEGSQPALRAPFMIAPKGTSAISGALSGATIRATNAGIHSGSLDQYTLGAVDATGETTVSPDADIRATGAQTYDYWGVGGDVLFAVNMQNRFGSPSTNTYDVLMDVNRDGDYTDPVDRDVMLADCGLIFADTDSGQFCSFVFDGNGGYIDYWWVLTTFNSSNLIAPVPLVELGLTPGSPRFDYMVTSFSRITGLRDQTPKGSYNYLNPTTSSGGYAVIQPGGSATVPGVFNAAENALTPSAGWLLMYEDNATGASQAQILYR